MGYMAGSAKLEIVFFGSFDKNQDRSAPLDELGTDKAISQAGSLERIDLQLRRTRSRK